MTAEERQSVVQLLETSERRVLGLIEGLTAAQWSFREAPERWSIAEIIEHLAVFEVFLQNVIQRSLTEAVDGKSDARKDAVALRLANGRATRIESREVNLPTGRWPDPADAVAEFRRARRQSIEFAESTQEDLRAHTFPHLAFGDVDCYQWLLILGQHALRHAFQVEEVKMHDAYPA